ncbi:unnamed protein product, partial [Rotaria sp. Silwood1]
FEESAEKLSQTKSSGKASHTQKERQDEEWKETFFFHVDSSDIVAHVKNEVHGCFMSSVSEDVDTSLSRLYEINKTADKILYDRSSKISFKEQAIINKIIQERQNIIEQIIKKKVVHI